MRHLMTQQRATREMLEHLANALAAGPSGECAAAAERRPGGSGCVAAHQALASTIAGHLRDLAAAPQLDAAVSRMEGLLGPPPTAAEVRGQGTSPGADEEGCVATLLWGIIGTAAGRCGAVQADGADTHACIGLAQVGVALSSQDCSEAEKHMGAWLATVISWLHTTALADPDAAACNSPRQDSASWGSQACAAWHAANTDTRNGCWSSSSREEPERQGSRRCACGAGAPRDAASLARLQGALEVVVTRLVDRAFATQTAVVHSAHTLARQAHALSSANQQLRKTRQVGASQVTQGAVPCHSR